MQKHVNLVDLVKSFPTNIYLQNLASIPKRTSPVKFAHLAENQGKVRYRTFQLRSEEAESAISDESMDLGPLSPMKYEAKLRWRKRVGIDTKIQPDLHELNDAVDALGKQVLGRVRIVGWVANN